MKEGMSSGAAAWQLAEGTKVKVSGEDHMVRQMPVVEVVKTEQVEGEEVPATKPPEEEGPVQNAQ